MVRRHLTAVNTFVMVETSQHSYGLCSNLVQSSFSYSHAPRQSCLDCAESLINDRQSYMYEDNGTSASTEQVPEVENLNDINPGSSDASVNMYDFDSYFDDLLSDVTSAVLNVKKKLEKIKMRTDHHQHWLKSELDKFCCLPLEPREVDPLKWCKTDRSIFPELGKVVNKMLCSPPSSVESERLFSIGGNIYTPHRNRITAGDWREIDAP